MSRWGALSAFAVGWWLGRLLGLVLAAGLGVWRFRPILRTLRRMSERGEEVPS